MELLYNQNDGEIFYTVYDVDLFRFTHTTNIPLSEFQIDEVDPENKDICLDLFRTQMKRDINGLGKYYIESGELHSRDGWVERPIVMPEMPI